MIRTEHTTANFNVGTVVYPEIQSIGQQASPIDRKAKKWRKYKTLAQAGGSNFSKIVKAIDDEACATSPVSR